MRIEVIRFPNIPEEYKPELRQCTRTEYSWLRQLVDGELPVRRTDDVWVAIGVIDDSICAWAAGHATLVKFPLKVYPSRVTEFSVCVRPEQRRRGWGRRLLETLKEHLPGPYFGIPADPQGDSFYQSMGIHTKCSWKPTDTEIVEVTPLDPDPVFEDQ